MRVNRRFIYGVVPFALFGVGIAFCFCWWWCGRSSTTYLIVRHADRLEGADALSDLGGTRAEELVHVCRKARIEGIYHSEAERSRLTAQPTADALGIVPVPIDASDITALLDHIETHHRRGTVLIVGHSNTVPAIIRAAGGPAMPDIPDKEFDNLLNLQYGALSPTTL
jgi:broad specificity phosphatase PhoE